MFLLFRFFIHIPTPLPQSLIPFIFLSVPPFFFRKSFRSDLFLHFYGFYQIFLIDFQFFSHNKLFIFP